MNVAVSELPHSLLGGLGVGLLFAGRRVGHRQCVLEVRRATIEEPYSPLIAVLLSCFDEDLGVVGVVRDGRDTEVAPQIVDLCGNASSLATGARISGREHNREGVRGVEEERTRIGKLGRRKRRNSSSHKGIRLRRRGRRLLTTDRVDEGLRSRLVHVAPPSELLRTPSVVPPCRTAPNEQDPPRPEAPRHRSARKGRSGVTTSEDPRRATTDDGRCVEGIYDQRREGTRRVRGRKRPRRTAVVGDVESRRLEDTTPGRNIGGGGKEPTDRSGIEGKRRHRTAAEC